MGLDTNARSLREAFDHAGHVEFAIIAEMTARERAPRCAAPDTSTPAIVERERPGLVAPARPSLG